MRNKELRVYFSYVLRFAKKFKSIVMLLAGFAFMLKAQITRFESEYTSASKLVNIHADLARHHRLEGILSSTWQAYCKFVRHVCIESAKGCTTAQGLVHPPSIAPVSVERASFIALKAARNHPITAGGSNIDLWKEPTWGDSAKIVDIINALNPGNGTILKGAFSGGLNGPKHCQVVRNACAHNNSQTRAAVVALAPSYIATHIRYPTDSLLWIDPTTGDDAYVSWLNDIKIITDAAVA